MKKKLISFAIVLGVFITLGLNVLAYTGGVGTTTQWNAMQNQEKSNWCWVASARNAVSLRKTVTASQSAGVTYGWGNTNNSPGTTTDIQNVAFYFSNYSYSYSYQNYSLPFSSVVSCIAGGRPVIAGTGLGNAQGVRVSGHVVCIYYVDESTAKIRYKDPNGSLGVTLIEQSFNVFDNGTRPAPYTGYIHDCDVW